MSKWYSLQFKLYQFNFKQDGCEVIHRAGDYNLSNKSLINIKEKIDLIDQAVYRIHI